MKKHICSVCAKEFKTGPELGGHIQLHKKTINELKCDKSRRTHLINTYGHKCFVCQLLTWLDKPITLELDHIDGNSENNIESNLRILCPNCHSQTSTWKGRNMGKSINNKRQQRRKFYGS